MSEKTPDDDSVEMDPVDRLREAWCHENATWGDDGSAEFERVLAKIRDEAVAEYKAKVFARGDVIGDLATIWG